CGSEPLRLRETQRPEQTLPPIHVEEARGAIEDHDLVAVRRTVCRWAPGFRSRHEAARNLLSAEVHRQTGDDTNDDHCERGRSQPHPRHPASAESSLGRAASRAASASLKRQRSRSCSSISLETARTSTADTPASLAARNTAKPSIASTSQSLVPPTRALVPIGRTRASGSARCAASTRRGSEAPAPTRAHLRVRLRRSPPSRSRPEAPE